jgi:hypothetical protein
VVKVSLVNRCEKKKPRRKYTKGVLNRLIDDLIHPLSSKKPELMLLDAVLHGFVEQNPQEAAVKFIRYTLPKIIKETLEDI